MSNHTLILISNRLPISVAKENGKLIFNPSSGGLATAMSSLKGSAGKQLWIGWPGIGADELTAAEKTQVTKELRKFNCRPVFLTTAQIKLFYDGYANETIWPLFHYFQSSAQFNEQSWAAYQSVNRQFAKVVARTADPQATIWVHDYHLMLLPQLLHAALPGTSIGFFLHIPFPSFEIFRILPNRREILEGLLGADLLGFHTYDYAQYFTNSVRRTLGYQVSSSTIMLSNRVVVADAFPIGIDYQKFATALTSEPATSELDMLAEHYQGKKIILSVDRLDYTKGIPNRLRAFEEFLRQNPRYHKKVCLVMVAVPSRTEVQTYKDLRDTVEQIVSRINGTYATIDWTPISYQCKNLPFEQVVALYAKAAVALVTPLRDGMNLVAKEYVASKQDGNGVLILSELAGAADELQEAIRINPSDADSMVSALKQALTMPRKEQQRRMRAMQKRLSRYTVQRWAHDFMEQLAAAKQLQVGQSHKLLSRKRSAEIINACTAAKRRMFFLDYDGTLQHFVNTPDPAKASPSKALRNLLVRLAEKPHTTVCIISGRTRDALSSWFNDLPLTLVAEHGAWIKQNGVWTQSTAADFGFKTALRPILEHYVERTPGAVLEEKDMSLVWHYRSVSPELAYARNMSLRHALTAALNHTDVGIFNGDKVIEVKPRHIQKGFVANKLLRQKPADFVFCAGDDYTDEDMFEALPKTAFSVKVGLEETCARYQVASVKELRALLESTLGNDHLT